MLTAVDYSLGMHGWTATSCRVVRRKASQPRTFKLSRRQWRDGVRCKTAHGRIRKIPCCTTMHGRDDVRCSAMRQMHLALAEIPCERIEVALEVAVTSHTLPVVRARIEALGVVLPPKTSTN